MPPPPLPPLAHTPHAPAATPQQQPPQLCTMYIGHGMESRGFEDPCPIARYYFRRKMGPPGGAVCVDANSTARCTQFGSA